MSVPIIFEDVELWATGYLRPKLTAFPGVFVSNRREDQATAVWVRRDGGPVSQHVLEQARLGVNVFAPTEQAVDLLARTVAAHLRAAGGDAAVVRVRQTSGPSPIADESPRRYMTFEVTTRGTELS